MRTYDNTCISPRQADAMHLAWRFYFAVVSDDELVVSVGVA